MEERKLERERATLVHIEKTLKDREEADKVADEEYRQRKELFL